MSELVLEARNASLEQMLQILQTQEAHKLDLVVPAEKLRFTDGQLDLRGLDQILEADGITDPNGLYLPTAVFDEKLAEYLKIPVAYLRRMRAERPDLYDANANGWLLGRKEKIRPVQPLDDPTTIRDHGFGDAYTLLREGIPADTRKFLLRLFQAAEGNTARTILSNKYKIMENLDGLLAVLAGIKEAGIDPATLQFDRCDLTEKRMYVKVTAPEIKALAPELLKGYRNPFAGDHVQRADSLVRGRDIDEWRKVAAREGMAYSEEEGGEPVVFAGLVFSNSPVGHGKWNIQGLIEVQICKNGLTFAEDSFGKVHLGAALDEGAINWSDETQDRNMELVASQTKDAVKQFLSVEFVEAKVAQIEGLSGTRLNKPADDIKAVTKKLQFTEEQTTGILEHFMLGGQITAGGLMQAITSYSQTVEDADVAYEMDNKAVRALEMAAALR